MIPLTNTACKAWIICRDFGDNFVCIHLRHFIFFEQPYCLLIQRFFYLQTIKTIMLTSWKIIHGQVSQKAQHITPISFPWLWQERWSVSCILSSKLCRTFKLFIWFFLEICNFDKDWVFFSLDLHGQTRLYIRIFDSIDVVFFGQ